MRADVIIFGQSLNSQFLKGLTHSAMSSPRPGEVGTPHCSAIEDKGVRRSNLNIKTLTKQLFTQGEQEFFDISPFFQELVSYLKPNCSA